MTLAMKNLEQTFREAVRTASGSAQGYSLSFVKQSIESVIAGQPPTVMVLDYLIPSSNVRIAFSLSLTNGALLVVHIYSLDGKFFSLSEYLNKHKMEETLESLFENRCDLSEVLKTIIALFNGHMNEIVTGKRWEDIPRDWMGYK